MAYFYVMTRFIVIFLYALSAFSKSNAQEINKWKITDVQEMLNAEGGVVVLNCWATFCKPCVGEIPHFIRTVEQFKNRGVNLYLLSLDLPSQYPEKIRQFINIKQFKGPQHAWLEETDADYFCPKIDSLWSGSIPATLILNRKTGYRAFFEEEMTSAKLEIEIERALSSRKVDGSL
jgi:thiol-disulfide isomerase/thioredoxin